MPVGIQGYPRGLNEVLGIKGVGRGPAVLADSAMGILEMLDFYGAEFWSRESLVDAALATAGTLTIPVPQNEVWIPKYISATALPGAATYIQLGLHLRAAPMPSHHPLEDMIWHGTMLGGATGAKNVTYTFPTVFVCRQGSSFRAVLNMIGAATLATELDLGFYRFLV